MFKRLNVGEVNYVYNTTYMQVNTVDERELRCLYIYHDNINCSSERIQRRRDMRTRKVAS